LNSTQSLKYVRWNFPHKYIAVRVLGAMKLKCLVWSKVNLLGSNFMSAIRPKIYFCEFSIQNNVILLYYLCVMTLNILSSENV
jgi:hypothetical protein